MDMAMEEQDGEEEDLCGCSSQLMNTPLEV